MAGTKFDIEGDASSLMKALQQAQQAINNTVRAIEGTGQSVDKSFKKMGDSAKNGVEGINSDLDKLKKALGAIGLAFSGKELIDKVVQVRGEFQQLEVAMKTMLGGSQEAASKLMGEMTTLAATTPFGLQEVAGGAKQLLAYGMEANKLTDTLTRLGNIASGLSIPLNDLIYLYGTTMAQGRMMTQDVMQFAGRGIPIIAELAKQFGVAESEVKDLVSQGRVGFEHLEGVIASLTNQGGMFFNLMQEQSKTIPGQISNLEDSIDMMLNDLGKATEGVISDSISLANLLVENYRTVGDVILTLVATYGTYRTALMLNIAMEKVAALSRLAQIKGMQTHALVAQILSGKLKALYATMTAHPYALAAAAVIALVGAMVTMANATSAAEKEADRMKKRTEEQAKETDELKNKTQELRDTIVDETKTEEERQEALNKLKSLWPDVFSDYETYIEYSNNAAEALRRETEALRNRNREQQKTNYKEDVSHLEAIQNFIKVDNRLRKQYENKGIDKNTYIKTDEYKNALVQLKGAYHDLTGEYSGFGDGGYFATKWANDMLPNVRKSVNKQTEEIRQSINAEFEAGVSKMSEEALTSTIEKYQEWIKNANNEGKKWIDMGEVPIAVSTIQSRIEQMQTRLDTINKDANRDFVKDAKTAYDKAKKDTEKIRNNQHGYKTETEWAKALKEAEDKEKTAKKKYEEYLGESAKSIQSAQEKKAQSLKKANDLLLSIQQDNNEQEVKLMEEGNDKIIAQIDSDWEKRKQEIIKQAKEFAKLNKTAGIKGSESLSIDGETIGGLTAEQLTELNKAVTLNNKNKAKSTSDALKQEIDAMRNYLIKYGSFEQKRNALSEDYDRKISKATTEGEKLSLQKEKEQRLANLSVDEISKGIDWNALFSGVGNLTKDVMQQMYEQLKVFVKKDDYANADAETQRQVTELIQNMRQYLGTDQSVTWETLAQALTDFTTAQNIYNDAVKDEKDAIKQMQDAKNAYESGKGTKEAYDKAVENANKFSEATIKAEDNMSTFADKLNETSDIVANYTSGLTTALNNAKGWEGIEGMSELKSGVASADRLKGTLDSMLPSMAGGTQDLGNTISSALGSGLSSLGSSLGNVFSTGIGGIVGVVAQIPNILRGIVGGVTNIITGLTDFISLRWIDELVLSLLDALSGLIDAVFKLPENLGKVIMSLVEGVGGFLDGVVGGIGNILSFGLLDSSVSSWFGGGGNADEINAEKEERKKENERLVTALENLTDALDDAHGMQAIEITEEAIRKQEKINANKKANIESQMAYHHAHSSFNKYWGGFSKEQIDKLSKAIGRDWDGSLLSLTPEEMQILLGFDDLVNTVGNTGKGSYGWRVVDDMREYAKEAGKIEELTNQLKEALTSITFDSMYDSFMSSLMDMDASAEEIAGNISEYFFKAMMNNVFAEKYMEEIQSIYDKWADINKKLVAGEITESQAQSMYAELKDDYNQVVNDAMIDRDNIADITGYNDETRRRGSSSRSVASMSQDTAEELNGRFTAIQIATQSISASLVSAMEDFANIRATLLMTNKQLSEIVFLAIMRNSFLDDIRKYTKEMLVFGDILTRMETKIATL